MSPRRLLADEMSYLGTQAEVTQFTKGEYPEGIGGVTSVAVLGLFTSKDMEGTSNIVLGPLDDSPSNGIKRPTKLKVCQLPLQS